MAFNFTFNVLQLEPFPVAGQSAAVRVSCNFSNEVPPVVEVYWGFHGVLLNVPRDVPTGGEDTGEVTLQIPAGSLVDIAVCPRQLDGNGVKTLLTQPRDAEAVHYETLMGRLDRVPVKATEPVRPVLEVPVIVDAVVSKGRIRLTWSHAAGCSFFEIAFGPEMSMPWIVEVEGEVRSYDVRRVSAGAWRLSVGACWNDRFFGIRIDTVRSDWASVVVQVPADQGWEPWTNGVPGEWVAVGHQKAADRTIVLHVAADGRPYVTWPIGFNGWQEPAAIGPAGVAPPGAGIAVVQQAPSVVTAMAIGMDGRMTTWSVNDTAAWVGPGAFGGRDFPPGAAVSLEKQTDTIAVAAAVDVHGAVNVAWTEGTEDWRNPSPITGQGFAEPGATVVLRRLAEDLLALLVAGSDRALHLAWVDGAGGWRGPVELAGPRGFEGRAGPALSRRGGDIAVAIAMSTEMVPYRNHSEAKGPWSVLRALPAAAAAPTVAGVALGSSGFDRITAAWVDEDGALETASVVTGQPWTDGTVQRPGPFAVPGSRSAAHGQTLAFVDPAGRLAMLDLGVGGVGLTGPVLA